MRIIECDPIFKNVSITNNSQVMTSQSSIRFNYSNATFENVTIAHNEQGIYFNPYCEPSFTNVIIWNNNQSGYSFPQNTTINYSDIRCRNCRRKSCIQYFTFSVI